MPTWVREPEPEPVGLGESVQFDIRPGVVSVTMTRVGRQDVCHGQNEAEQPRDYYRSDHLEETMFQCQIILRNGSAGKYPDEMEDNTLHSRHSRASSVHQRDTL